MDLLPPSSQEFALDFYAGGVPAYAILHMHLEDIRKLLLSQSLTAVSRIMEELAYIGVVSYAEAFFKDHFASIVNIVPEKIGDLKKNGQDVSADLTSLLALQLPLHTKFGFLLSERFNFGSPKSTNALYKALLLISPFSIDNAKAFDQVLMTRNLLVHHGGTFTSHFAKNAETSGERVFFDSVRITKADVAQLAILVNVIATNTVIATAAKLSNICAGLDPSDIRRKALELMSFEIDESSALTLNFEDPRLSHIVVSTEPNASGEDVPF